MIYLGKKPCPAATVAARWGWERDQEGDAPMSKLGILVAAVLALAASSVAVWAWISLGEVTMSTGGYLALVLGGIATMGLGVGLMALVFYSNRKGYDEAAARPPLRHNLCGCCKKPAPSDRRRAPSWRCRPAPRRDSPRSTSSPRQARSRPKPRPTTPPAPKRQRPGFQACSSAHLPPDPFPNPTALRPLRQDRASYLNISSFIYLAALLASWN